MSETLLIPASNPDAYLRALEVLKQGGLVCFPTDTVYGLAASIRSPQGIHRLYTAKGRTWTKAIPVLAATLAQAAEIASDWPPAAERLGKAFWPGPLTLVLPGSPELPHELSPDGTVGVRIPDHPVALELIRLSGPLATTSANLSGQKEALSAGEVMNQLSGRVDMVLDGGMSPGGVPSTVIRLDGDSPGLLRPGPISLQEIIRTAEIP
jgi:L-threonylcarbamoyladenylate synthase